MSSSKFVLPDAFTSVKDKVINRRHGEDSLFRSWTVLSDEIFTIQFLGDGLSKIATKSIVFPVEVWFNLVDKQHEIDHHIFCLKVGNAWDIGTDESKWDIELEIMSDIAYCLTVRGEAMPPGANNSKEFMLFRVEWEWIKDCMIPYALHTENDVKLGIYTMGDILRELLRKVVEDECLGCALAQGEPIIYGIRHSCIAERRKCEQIYYDKATSLLDPVEFSDRIRREAKRKGIFIHAPYMVFHIVRRFNMTSVRMVSMEPVCAFKALKG